MTARVGPWPTFLAPKRSWSPGQAAEALQTIKSVHSMANRGRRLTRGERLRYPDVRKPDPAPETCSSSEAA